MALKWLRGERLRYIIENLRKADKTSLMGFSIHHALDNKIPFKAIIKMLIEAWDDDDKNDVKKMPKILGEGYYPLKQILRK
jgi:hypothetical protein